MRTFLSGLAIAILAHAETAQADTVETFMNGNSLLAHCQGDARDRSGVPRLHRRRRRRLGNRPPCQGTQPVHGARCYRRAG